MHSARVWVEQRSRGSRYQQVRRLQRHTRGPLHPGGWWSRGATLGFRIDGDICGRQDGEMGGEGPDCVGLCGHIQHQNGWDSELSWKYKLSTMHIVRIWRKCLPNRQIFVCAEPPIFDVQKKERMFVSSLQKIWWQVRVFIFWDLEAQVQVYMTVRPFMVKPQNATHQDKCRGKVLLVSAGLSIFNDGVRPSSCAIDPIRLRKEG